ncbi:MAG: radical SAM protein [Candidatus Hermodarchaeota archaeon]
MLSQNSVLLLEVTTKCNLNCIHCFGNKSKINILSLDQIRQIFLKANSYGITDLILTGGEPFLRSDIFEVIHYAEKSGIKNIAITTNGLMLESKSIVRNVKKNLNTIVQLFVGFNGATSTTHDFIRGEGQFDKLIHILQNKALRKFPLGIDACIGKWNVHEIYDFFETADMFDGKFFNFVPFIPIGEGKNLMDQVLSPLECKRMIEMVKKKKEEGYYVDLCFTPYAKLISKELTGCCNLLSEFLTITAQGDVIPCLYMKEYNFGSFLSNEIEQIYSNPKAGYFLQPQSYQNRMKGSCGQCQSFNICGGGCKIVTYALKGTIFDTDPLCPFTR